jgi:hypothetical protein
MPLGGYRPFVIAACRRAFADFRYTSRADGLNPGGRRAAKGMTPFPSGLARTVSI